MTSLKQTVAFKTLGLHLWPLFLSIINYNRTEQTKSLIQIQISKMLYFAQRSEKGLSSIFEQNGLQTQTFFQQYWARPRSPNAVHHFKYSEPRSSDLNRYHNQFGAWWPWPPHCSNINTSDYFCGISYGSYLWKAYLILLWPAKWHMQLPEAAVQMLLRQILQNILTLIRSVSEVSVNMLIMLWGNIRISCGHRPNKQTFMQSQLCEM